LTDVQSVTDFGDLPVFGATAYPMIFIGQKGAPRKTTLFTPFENLDPPYPDVLAVTQEHGVELSQEAISGHNWSLNASQSTARLVETMKKKGESLGKHLQVYRGIVTGLNTAFIINGSTRAALLEQDPESAKVIKPLVVGKNIRRWAIDRQDKWLLYMYHGIDVTDLDVVLEYLKPYKPQLEKRATRQEWYELQQPQMRYIAWFGQPKIVFPDIALNPRFAFDVEQMYMGDTTFFMPTNDIFLVGILNSSIIASFFASLGAQVRGGYLRFKRQYVEQIPIPDAPAAERKAIAKLAQQCVEAKGQGAQVAAWEAEIDARVARLYGLSEGDFAYILDNNAAMPEPSKLAARNFYRDLARGGLT
jgi:hypothetical protein